MATRDLKDQLSKIALSDTVQSQGVVRSLWATLFACFERASCEVVFFGSFCMTFIRDRPRRVEPSSSVLGAVFPVS